MAMALLSLAGFFIALYLHLYKIGKIGSLACGTGGCETVQLSSYSSFLGIGVALIGVIGYAVMFVTAMLLLQPRFAGPSWPLRAMVLLSGGAVLFAGYLTYVELFVIEAICRYCVVSAVLVTSIFLLSLFEFSRSRRESQPSPA
jgi:uncharacterized membrane protein